MATLMAIKATIILIMDHNTALITDIILTTIPTVIHIRLIIPTTTIIMEAATPDTGLITALLT